MKTRIKLDVCFNKAVSCSSVSTLLLLECNRQVYFSLLVLASVTRRLFIDTEESDELSISVAYGVTVLHCIG